jgi:hypothetical protein
MYLEVSYPQDSCTLYIPAERYNIIQPIIILNLFFLHGNESIGFFLILKVFRRRAAPGEIDLDSTGGSALGSPWILLIR